MFLKIQQRTVREEASSNSSINNSGNGTNPGSQSPPWFNGTSSSDHGNPPNDQEDNHTVGVSRATLGGSIAGGVVGTALAMGLIWWIWRMRKTRRAANAQRNPSKRWRGWVDWIVQHRKGQRAQYTGHARDTKERIPIDADDDSSQILQGKFPKICHVPIMSGDLAFFSLVALPNPATHLSLPPDVHLTNNITRPLPMYQEAISPSLDEAVPNDGTGPPRYWQIHNSPSAVSLHRDLSCHKHDESMGITSAPAPSTVDADHGHDTHSSLDPLSGSLETLPSSAKASESSPSSPVSRSVVDLRSPHNPHDDSSRWAPIPATHRNMNPAADHLPDSESSSTRRNAVSSPLGNELEHTIRDLRREVEVLKEENARLRHSDVVSPSDRAEVVEGGRLTPAPQSGDKSDLDPFHDDIGEH
ncbi:hypothetical protein EV360DRAFT_88315 [Lentinula raphanica]|nr:hypothetical protein EV360DRAFT_88315 [Lentinula raphanica]